MPDGRDVTLKIKVNDTEVKEAEVSLKRLKTAANDVGTSSKGPKAVETSMGGVTDATSEATAAVAEASTGMSAMSVVALASAAAIAAVAVALVAAAAAAVILVQRAFDLAKAFAAYGNEIEAATKATGLAAESVSALRHEAERTGTSFKEVESALGEFRKTIGAAAGDSDKAKASLKLLGIDGKAAMTNIDGAFKTAVASIVAAPAGIEQTRKAFAAFGDEGYKLIPFFQSFNGNVDEAIKRTQDLGIQLSGKDVQASREFTKAFEDVKAAIEGVKLAFGRQFLDAIAGALRDFTAWVTNNKTAIESWATSAGHLVNGIIIVFEKLAKWMDDHPLIVKIATGALQLTNAGIVGSILSDVGNKGTPNFDPSLNPTPAAQDPAALEALRQQEEEKQKEAADRLKRDFAAALESWKNYATGVEKDLSERFGKLRDELAAGGPLNTFSQSVQAAVQKYVNSITVADAKTKEIEDQIAARDNITANEKSLLLQKQQDRQKDHQQKMVDIVDQGNKLLKAENDKRTKTVLSDQKKSIDDQLAEMQIAGRRQAQLQSVIDQTLLDLQQQKFEQGKISERSYLDFIQQTQVAALNAEKAGLQAQLKAVQDAAAQRPDLDGSLGKKRADLAGQIATIEAEIKRTQLIPALTQEEQIRQRIAALKNIDASPQLAAERRSIELLNEELNLRQQITQLKDNIANGGANDALVIEAAHLQDIIDLRNRELDAVIRINRAQLELSKSMEISNNQIRAGVYEHLAAQKTLNESIVDGINGTFDAITKQMDVQLDKLNSWSKGLLSFIVEPLKAIQHKAVSNIFKNLVDGLFPGTGLGDTLTQTNNPVARPIVDEIKETNKILTRIAGGSGSGSGSGSGGSLGGVGSLLDKFRNFGIGSIGGGGIGPGGTPNFNPSATGGGGGLPDLLNVDASIFGAGGRTPGAGATPGLGGGGGILSKVFGKGGIFGGDGFGNNQGTYSGIGAIAGVVGGAVGGRIGNIIGLAGQGLSLGFMVGGPIGAAIGAGIGALIGIFMGDPKKKQDKNTNIPKLEQGFSDSMTQLTQILTDIRSLNGDPDTLVSKARDIRAQIAGGFGIQFSSKQYQKQSQAEIAATLAAIDREPDGLMAQILAAAGIARGAADRSKRILPEFAGGNYFADFFRPNGLIPGSFDGADNILAMISRGEAVLNPTQMARARAAAGFDVFAHAGIPNYPHSTPSTKFAAGGIAGSGFAMAAPVVQNNVTLVVQGVTFHENAQAWIESDDGSRTLVNIVKKKQKSGDL